MPAYVTTTMLSILGALIVAGIVAWIRKPRLVYLVPKLFTTSNLSAHGQLAEITIFNRGFGNEEDVVVSLNPKLLYEVVGSTTRDYLMQGCRVSFPRIGANKDVTVVLTIEGGPFSTADIESCLSKGTTGVGATSLEQVPSSGQSKIAGVIAFVAVPLLAFAIFKGLDALVDGGGDSTLAATQAAKDANAAASAASKAVENATKARDSVVVNGWTVSSIYQSDSSELFKALRNGALSFEMGRLSAKADVVTVPVLAKNLTNMPLRFSVDLTTVGSEASDRIPSYERGINDAFLPSTSSSLKKGKVIISEQGDEAARTVWVEVFVKSLDGDSLKINRTFTADFK